MFFLVIKIYYTIKSSDINNSLYTIEDIYNIMEQNKQVRLSNFVLTKVAEIGNAHECTSEDMAFRYMLAEYEHVKALLTVSKISSMDILHLSDFEQHETAHEKRKYQVEKYRKVLDIIGSGRKNINLGQPVDFLFAELIRECTPLKIMGGWSRFCWSTGEDFESAYLDPEIALDYLEIEIEKEKRVKDLIDIKRFVDIIEFNLVDITSQMKIEAFLIADAALTMFAVV